MKSLLTVLGILLGLWNATLVCLIGITFAGFILGIDATWLRALVSLPLAVTAFAGTYRLFRA